MSELRSLKLEIDAVELALLVVDHCDDLHEDRTRDLPQALVDPSRWEASFHQSRLSEHGPNAVVRLELTLMEDENVHLDHSTRSHFAEFAAYDASSRRRHLREWHDIDGSEGQSLSSLEQLHREHHGVRPTSENVDFPEASDA